MNSYPYNQAFNPRNFENFRHGNVFQRNLVYNFTPSVQNNPNVNVHWNIRMPPLTQPNNMQSSIYTMESPEYGSALRQLVCKQLKTDLNMNGESMTVLQSSGPSNCQTTESALKTSTISNFPASYPVGNANSRCTLMQPDSNLNHQKTQSLDKPEELKVAICSDSKSETISSDNLVLGVKNEPAAITGDNIQEGRVENIGSTAVNPLKQFGGWTLGEIANLVTNSTGYTTSSRTNGTNSTVNAMSSTISSPNFAMNKTHSSLSEKNSTMSGTNSINETQTLSAINSAVNGKNFKNTSRLEQENLAEFFRRYTLRDIMNHFNSKQPSGNSGNGPKMVYEGNKVPNFEFFTGYTLLEIMAFLDDKEESNKKKLAGKITKKGRKNSNETNVFDHFTGYTLSQIMEHLNNSTCSFIENTVSDPSFNVLEMGHSDKDNPTSVNNCTPESVEDSKMEANVDPSANFQLSMPSDNPLNTRNESETNDGNNEGEVLFLYPEDYDRLNGKQFEMLKSGKTVKASSDFCLKFGHSEVVCPYGSECKFKEKEMCIICDRYCLSRNNPQAKQDHREECLAFLCLDRAQELAGEMNAAKKMSAEVCQMCSRIIPLQATICVRSCVIAFNCDHVFCMACAATCLRSLYEGDFQKVLVCGLCGTHSPLYAVSYGRIDGEEMEDFKRKFRECVKTAKCRFCTESSSITGICIHGRTVRSKHSVVAMAELTIYKTRINYIDNLLTKLRQS